LYSSPNIIRESNQRWTGLVAWMRHEKYIFCLGNLKGQNHLEDLGVDGNIALE